MDQDEPREETDEERELTGLAHVSTVSFLAARIAPSLQFWLALAGGVAVARASARRGLSVGVGASLAGMLQTVTIIGPLRISGPLTTAMSAPILGWLWARGKSFATLFAACLAVRITHYVIFTLFLVVVILGGIDTLIDSYKNITGFLRIDGILPQSDAFVIGFMSFQYIFFAFAFSAIQVMLYRRALPNWPEPGAGQGAVAEEAGDSGDTAEKKAGVPDLDAIAAGEHEPRFDPRVLALAAIVAFAVLLASFSWVTIAAVAGWLLLSSLVTRPEREILRVGAYLALFFAVSTVIIGLVGSLGLDEAARRALRAGLLVLVASWLRGAAGAPGMREIFHRTLARANRYAWARHGTQALERLDSGPRLATAGKQLMDDLEEIPAKPAPMADALVAWVSTEADSFRGVPPGKAPLFAVRARDAVLLALTVAPLAAAVGLTGFGG